MRLCKIQKEEKKALPRIGDTFQLNALRFDEIEISCCFVAGKRRIPVTDFLFVPSLITLPCLFELREKKKKEWNRALYRDRTLYVYI